MKNKLNYCLDCGKKLIRNDEKLIGLCVKCFSETSRNTGIDKNEMLWLKEVSKNLLFENAVKEIWEIANFDLEKTKSLNKVI